MSGLQKRTIDQYIAQRIKFWVWSLNNYEVLKPMIGLSTDQKDQLTPEDKLEIANFHNKIHDSVIVTGGAIASMLLGEPVNDLDLYFSNREIAGLVAQYYLNVASVGIGENWKVSHRTVINNADSGVAIFIKSMGVEGVGDTEDYDYFESLGENEIDKFFADYKAKQPKEPPKHSVKFITSNAITLNNDIQIILRFTGDPQQIHNNYDFVHATNYWTKDGGLVYRAEALQALLEKRLVYIGSRFPVSSLFRIRKFLSRGFRISAGEITKIAFDVSKLDLTDPLTLHDQLIGVDYAYFHQVINMLADPTKTGADRWNVNIDRTYLFKLLDRVYDGAATDVAGIEPDPDVAQANRSVCSGER
jgi:hypothetical protein